MTFPAAAEPLPPGKWLLRSIVGQERAYRVPDHAKTVTWPAMQANFDFEFQIDQHPKTATAFTRLWKNILTKYPAKITEAQ